MNVAMRLDGVTRVFTGQGGRRVQALTNVSLLIRQGETLGIVGESGCGKSTLARLLTRLDSPSSGTIELNGVDITTLSQQRLHVHRRTVQLVFQNPYAAFNPRQRIGQALAEILRVHNLVASREEGLQRVIELLKMVGLNESLTSRYPRQLSGGQLQRLGIARALAVEPSILVLDEAVSALDVSVQAEVLNLLLRLRDELNLTYVFISHDLGIVRHMSDRIAVMYLGRVVEIGHWKTLADEPAHPYAIALQKAVPTIGHSISRTRIDSPLSGEVPDPANPPSGCAFHTRCPHKAAVCEVERPELAAAGPDHLAACHLIEPSNTESLIEPSSAENLSISGRPNARP